VPRCACPHARRRGLGTLLAIDDDMASGTHDDLLSLLRRCVAIERGAARIYETIAPRFSSDRRFHDFWGAMAADEREHAHKLDTYLKLTELEDPAKRFRPEGFAESVAALEDLVDELGPRAARVRSRNDALAIALELESSELDTIYTTLLQISPIARFPDLADTRRVELGRHHRMLFEVVRENSPDERNRLLAAVLEAAD
jgi:rubrerythrin